MHLALEPKVLDFLDTYDTYYSFWKLLFRDFDLELDRELTFDLESFLLFLLKFDYLCLLSGLVILLYFLS